jgi:hypothetical protein
MQANKQNILFQHLSHWTEQAAKVYCKRLGAGSLAKLHTSLLNINPESNLQRDIKGIISELDIMLHIVTQQKEIFKRFRRNAEHIILAHHGQVPRAGSITTLEDIKRRTSASSYTQGFQEALEEFKRSLLSESRPAEWSWFDVQASELAAGFHDRIEELENLKTSAQSIAESVGTLSFMLENGFLAHKIDQVADLLARKQQQAGVVQTYQAVLQAEESVRQGRVIVVFTIVTIVFVRATRSVVQNFL